MQDSLLVMGECKIAGILWNAGVFKAGVEREVAFSQQLYSCCH